MKCKEVRSFTIYVKEAKVHAAGMSTGSMGRRRNGGNSPQPYQHEDDENDNGEDRLDNAKDMM
eukprot:2366471-Pyramimonas_sp.AAC.2